MFRKTLSTFFTSVAVLACLGWAATPAEAVPLTFQTATGATDSAGEPINAKATFTLGTNTITVALTNLIVDQTSVGQNVTALSFKISGNVTSTASLTSSSGTVRQINGNHTFSDSGPRSTGWGFDDPSGPQFTLDWFTRDKSIAGQQAQSTLVGSPGSNNKYNNANGSMTTSSHDPFLAGTLTFTIHAPGVTSSTGISNVIFSFGTTAGDDHPGFLAAPAPPGLVLSLSGIGCVLLAFGARRFLQPRACAA
jgi:hypothetical protein